MTKEEAKRILAAYRPGDQDRLDSHFAEALQETERDAELARWFAEEREFDRTVAAHVSSVPVPFGLKTRILANVAPGSNTRSRWVAALAAAATAAAAMFFLAQLIGVWRATGQHAGSLSDYEQEMMSFVKLPPPLEMESLEMGPIKQWILERKAPLAEIPPGIAAVETMGCRILYFRGYPVTLICFCHGQTVAHLLMVDRAALVGLKPRNPPVVTSRGDWTTATWVDQHYAYMVAVHDKPTAARQYLPHS
ncbi:MAG: hypothetical protein DME65_13595 [Verrucomicrobia bacterium]|nr:MAG: hypothetical protein DME65_13595 [Verrucomicrobiota bacterium]